MKHHLSILAEEIMAATAFAFVAVIVCAMAILLGGEE